MIPLSHRFVDDLSELTVPASAADAPSPELVVLNEPLARELGMDPDELRTEDGVRFLLGLGLPDDAKPVAMVYAGHQFGGYSPQLGDGRALLLGEVVTEHGLRDLHLKGSGPTPLSRGGDGYAALGPMLREYLVSEAMHALGVPTTRSLAVIRTGRDVVREEGALPGAVLVRVASSHLRVGTFQFARASNQMRVLVKLARHALERHRPEALQADNPPLELFQHVVAAQARLVAHWITVGFVHGVMNTDNMTVSGETIDYGPCAFLDSYSPSAVYSSIDTAGRYAYGSQPGVAQWNLARFAEALLPVVADEESDALEALTPLLEDYVTEFNLAWLERMAAKLGLPADTVTPEADLADLTELVTELHGYLEASGVDFTLFFRYLADAARGDRETVRGTTLELERLDAWLEKWLALSPDPEAMDRVNPVHIPRNHLVEEALTAATSGDMGPYEALLTAVTQPYDPIEGMERHTQPAPAEFTAGYQTFCGT